ncbi:hypothetical protein J2736_000080 [Paenibacillus qinlingensis]|uniref:Uncharacterized protein n=1 Tax=Paenibacillus qinlingensis TaxID=1837343 RepID=A0ABU1NPE7_9BACL|nr:hypothetical protein [Paenibacillus qinlingensis]
MIQECVLADCFDSLTVAAVVLLAHLPYNKDIVLVPSNNITSII